MKKLGKSAPSEQTYLLVAIGLLGLYILPYVWLGEGAYLTIHDNLDSDFLYLHLLHTTGTAFAFDPDTIIPNMMHGIPRAAFRTGLNLEVLSFWLLPPYTAQVVNSAVIHGIGFWGMYALLCRYVLAEPPWAVTQVAVALLFALVPCSVVHGASVTGQPLLLFAFFNLLTRQPRWYDWLIIILFPFYSFFVWAGLFICVALGVIGVVSMVRNRAINWAYVTGLAALSGLYCLSEWQMIYSFLAKTYVSHRTEYDYARLLPLSVVDSFRRSVQLLVKTQYHSGAFVTIGILVVATWAAFRAFRRGNAIEAKLIVLLMGTGVVICLINGFYRYPAVWLGPGSILQVFQFDRFYFLLPLLWLYVFALALRRFTPNGWLNRLFLVGQFAVMVLANDEWRINLGKITGRLDDEQYPTYRAFYAPTMFDAIRAYIGRPAVSYRVVSIGMHPAVALYNGFYTFDSYQNNYLLSYKHAFRPVIAAELDKAPAIRTYYDAYGCRCYTFSAELGMSKESVMCGKHQNRSIHHLSLNTEALRALGGQYVLSAVPIRNADQNQLRLERTFTDSDSYWKVWLYRVK